MDRYQLRSRPDDLPPIASPFELADFVEAQTHHLPLTGDRALSAHLEWLARRPETCGSVAKFSRLKRRNIAGGSTHPGPGSLPVQKRQADGLM